MISLRSALACICLHATLHWRKLASARNEANFHLWYLFCLAKLFSRARRAGFHTCEVPVVERLPHRSRYRSAGRTSHRCKPTSCRKVRPDLTLSLAVCRSHEFVTMAEQEEEHHEQLCVHSAVCDGAMVLTLSLAFSPAPVSFRRNFYPNVVLRSFSPRFDLLARMPFGMLLTQQRVRLGGRVAHLPDAMFRSAQERSRCDQRPPVQGAKLR